MTRRGRDRPRPPGPPRRPLPVRCGPSPRAAVAVAAGVWLVVTALAVLLVLYGVGPMLEQRDQTALLSDYRVEIRQAAAQTNGLPGVELPTRAPETGSPVAILDIPEMKLEQVVVEGVGPQQTRRGPGHVPGTAGPGQPGNSAIVARRSTFGGPFRPLGSLEPGDEILVTTTQGQSIYVVTEVRSDEVADGSGGTRPQPADVQTTTTTGSAGDPPVEAVPHDRRRSRSTPPCPRATLTTDDLYGRTDDDRLTLVTSAATRPWNTARATDRRRRDAGPAVPAHAAVGAHRRRRTAVPPTAARGRRSPSPLLAYAGGGRRRASCSTAEPAPAPPTSSPRRRSSPRSILTAEAVARLLPAWT